MHHRSLLRISPAVVLCAGQAQPQEGGDKKLHPACMLLVVADPIQLMGLGWDL